MTPFTRDFHVAYVAPVHMDDMNHTTAACLTRTWMVVRGGSVVACPTAALETNLADYRHTVVGYIGHPSQVAVATAVAATRSTLIDLERSVNWSREYPQCPLI